MNLDELQSVQARERQSSDLQHLRPSFYREVGEFIGELTTERARVVEGTEDPFSSPTVKQLSDDIETAEQTVEAIYERRVGKVVKKASIAAAGMPVDDDGLTSEEEVLFEDLVARIEQNRATVLSILDDDGPRVSCSFDPETTDSDDVTESPRRRSTDDPSDEDRPLTGSDGHPDTVEGVNAADLMGDGAPDEALDESGDDDGRRDADRESELGGSRTDTEDPNPASDPLAADPESDRSDGGPREVPPEAGAPGSAQSDPDRPDEGGESGSAGTTSAADVARTTVRITADVGEVVGADNRDYDLAEEDVVSLPEPNADALVAKDVAERLE